MISKLQSTFHVRKITTSIVWMLHSLEKVLEICCDRLRGVQRRVGLMHFDALNQLQYNMGSTWEFIGVHCMFHSLFGQTGKCAESQKYLEKSKSIREQQGVVMWYQDATVLRSKLLRPHCDIPGTLKTPEGAKLLRNLGVARISGLASTLDVRI